MSAAGAPSGRSGGYDAAGSELRRQFATKGDCPYFQPLTHSN